MRYDTYRYLYPPRPETAAAPTTLGVYEAQGWLSQAKLNGTNCTIYVKKGGTSFAMGRHGPTNRLQWQPGTRWDAFERGIVGGEWFVLTGELLHSKGVRMDGRRTSHPHPASLAQPSLARPSLAPPRQAPPRQAAPSSAPPRHNPDNDIIRDTIYLFDLLVANGKYLLGQPYVERFQRLAQICEDAAIECESVAPLMPDFHTHTMVAPGVWLAINHTRDFARRFDAIRNLPGKPPIEGLVFKHPAARLLPCGTASANAKWQAKCRVATAHLSF